MLGPLDIIYPKRIAESNHYPGNCMHLIKYNNLHLCNIFVHKIKLRSVNVDYAELF